MLAAVLRVTETPRRVETRRQVAEQAAFVGERLARRIVPPGRRPRSRRQHLQDHRPPAWLTADARRARDTKNTQSLAIPGQDRNDRPIDRHSQGVQRTTDDRPQRRRIKLHDVDAPTACGD